MWRVGSLKSCTGRYLTQGVGSGATRRTQACRTELMNYEADQDAEVRKGATGRKMQGGGSIRRDMTERFYGAFMGRAQAHRA